VGIGTSSPDQKLVVQGGSGAAGMKITDGTYSSFLATISTANNYGNGSLAGQLYLRGQAGIGFSGNGGSNTQMSLDSSGNLLVGTTSLLTGSPRLNVSSTGSYTATFNQTDNTDRVAIRIQNTYAQSSQNATMIQFVDSAGSERGSIKTTGTTTSYNTSSDYRLKENIQPMTGALATVAQLNPVTYNWKADGSAGQGFIAHELQAVVPDCVTGTKDAVDADGNPVYQGIDTSFLTATLAAALQELHQIVKDQAAEIAALKDKLP
jgi:hypothetical protein